LIDPTLMLPDYTRSRANGYLDWLGPAVARHPDFAKFDVVQGGRFIDDTSKWKIDALPFSSLVDVVVEVAEDDVEELEKQALNEESIEVNETVFAEVQNRFNWTYPHELSVSKRSKQTVSELKRLAILELAENDPFIEKSDSVSTAYLHSRPEFMQTRSLSAAEIGTAMHTIMQHVAVHKMHDKSSIDDLIAKLTDRQLLTVEEAMAVNVPAVAQFFETQVGQRLMAAEEVFRELPFTYAHDGGDGDYQILQGIADCLFKEDDGWVLLDYKTDRVSGGFDSATEINAEMQERYGIQLNLYRRAIEAIAKVEIKEMVLYLFDGARTVQIQEVDN